MDKAGDRWWPILGSVYFVVAVKRVRGMRLLQPVWKRAHAGHRQSVPTVNQGQSSTSTRQATKADHS
jgi:hypothetical protein